MMNAVAEPEVSERVFTLFERNRELLTPEDFLRLSPEDRENILRARIVPPDLDRPDFGLLEVEYKIPRFAL